MWIIVTETYFVSTLLEGCFKDLFVKITFNNGSIKNDLLEGIYFRVQRLEVCEHKKSPDG